MIIEDFNEITKKVLNLSPLQRKKVFHYITKMNEARQFPPKIVSEGVNPETNEHEDLIDEFLADFWQKELSYEARDVVEEIQYVYKELMLYPDKHDFFLCVDVDPREGLRKKIPLGLSNEEPVNTSELKKAATQMFNEYLEKIEAHQRKSVDQIQSEHSKAIEEFKNKENQSSTQPTKGFYDWEYDVFKESKSVGLPIKCSTSVSGELVSSNDTALSDLFKLGDREKILKAIEESSVNDKAIILTDIVMELIRLRKVGQ
jgi:preprotein translocase subunit SecA